MKTLKTATGKEFEILWIGPSTIDGALRFAVVNSDIDTIHNTFKRPEETETLTASEDGVDKVYSGYLNYRGFDKKIEGEVVVAINYG